MMTKDLLPKSLFGRALLILVLPTVLIQMVLTYVFFDRHWETIKGYLASNLAGEIAFFVRQIDRVSDHQREQMAMDFESLNEVDVDFDAPSSYKTSYASGDFPEFQSRLRLRIEEPFTVRRIGAGDVLEIRIQLPGEVLKIKLSVKRLESRTTLIFMLWVVGASTVLLFIAVLFLRNQIRPIRSLAEAADNFGRGVDTPDFRPHGATEVRKAARAFVIMRERISRQLRTRTEMLAGISHDLRTPLTRMKLQLAMLGDSEAARELSDDVQQMEHMIAEYLDFARGEGREEAVRMRVDELLADVVADYQRLNAPVRMDKLPAVENDIRPSAFRRTLHNLIDNALRYGKQCQVGIQASANTCDIIIDDDGPGIPEDKWEEVFRPFSRLEVSRNVKTGGVGLGLSIARDIVLAHGGTISLGKAPLGGLRVTIRLPL